MPSILRRTSIYGSAAIDIAYVLRASDQRVRGQRGVTESVRPRPKGSSHYRSLTLFLGGERSLGGEASSARPCWKV
eukprot:5328335-Pyramimonas_sp.AAC.1